MPDADASNDCSYEEPDTIPVQLPEAVDADEYEARVAVDVERRLHRQERGLEEGRLQRAAEAVAEAETEEEAALRERPISGARLARVRARLAHLRLEHAAVLERLAVLGTSDTGASAESAAVPVVETTAEAPAADLGPVYESAAEALDDEDVPVDIGDERGTVLQAPRRLWTRLLEYQREGAVWMLQHHLVAAPGGSGGILGDEMGLGKTVQAVAFFAILHRAHMLGAASNAGPALVLAPATVLRQWAAECRRWYPPLAVRILHSSSSADDAERAEADALFSEKRSERHAKAADVLVTTYEQLIGLRGRRLVQRRYATAVLDEGHRIRNPETQVAGAVRQLAARTRLLVSGTPIQNDLSELWALLDWAVPGQLGTLAAFRTQLAMPIAAGGYMHATALQVQTAYRCAVALRQLVAPHLLRRLKAAPAVARDVRLPGKREQVLFCPLAPVQRSLYRAFLASPDVTAILSGARNVLAGIDVLRKICNHPDLLLCTRSGATASDSRPGKRRRAQATHTSSSEEEAVDSEISQATLDVLVARRVRAAAVATTEQSGKLVVLESILCRWWGLDVPGAQEPAPLAPKEDDGAHRVLLFCQTRQMLDILERWLRSHPHALFRSAYCRMDGQTPVAARKGMVDAFNAADSPLRLFLLTTRVGGLGLNLTGADRVVIFDPDWNPSTDMQARERAWRLGQTRPVLVLRMLTSGTIEERIYQRQVFKTLLTARILDDPGRQAGRLLRSADLYELFTLDEHDTGHGARRSGGARAGAHVADLDEALGDDGGAVESDTAASSAADGLVDEIVDAVGMRGAVERERRSLQQRSVHEVRILEREAAQRAAAAVAALRASAAAERDGAGTRASRLHVAGGPASAELLANLPSSPALDASDLGAAVEGAPTADARRLLALFRRPEHTAVAEARPLSSEAIARAFPNVEDPAAFRRLLRIVAVRTAAGLWILRPDFIPFLSRP